MRRCNAYVQPLMARYVRRLVHALDERGFRGRFHLMHSSGGLVAPGAAVTLSVRFLEFRRKLCREGAPDLPAAENSHLGMQIRWGELAGATDLPDPFATGRRALKAVQRRDRFGANRTSRGSTAAAICGHLRMLAPFPGPTWRRSTS